MFSCGGISNDDSTVSSLVNHTAWRSKNVSCDAD